MDSKRSALLPPSRGPWVFSFFLRVLCSLAFLQMVDKVWYDWQRRLPINKNAFGGGSISVFDLTDIFPQFPTGMPPYLNVSAPECPRCSASNLILFHSFVA